MENVTAIICEYNPFHRGHAYHIAQTRAQIPDAPVVCIMSGQFVQRGDMAILSKRARAEAALCAGASLVVELPMPYAVAGAERFAVGGALAAKALGASVLSFGSESGDTQGLVRTARMLESEEFEGLLKTALGTGVGFARARSAVMSVLAPELCPFLEQPNDILGVEYARAAEKAGIELLAIPRRGAGHDEDAERDGMISGSALRAYIRAGRTDISGFMPSYADTILRREREAGRAPVCAQRLDTLMLGMLRDYTPQDFVTYADVSEGLENRLVRALRESASMEAAYAAASSKRYPTARIRRAYWRAFLRLPAAYMYERPPFLRVLGLTPRGAEILKNAKLPVLAKPAHIGEMSARAKEWFALDERAGDLYALAYPGEAQRTGGCEKRMSPVFLE